MPPDPVRPEPTFLEAELIRIVTTALNDTNVSGQAQTRHLLTMEKSAVARGEANVRLLTEIKAELARIRAAVSEVDAGLDVVAHAAVGGATAAKIAAAKPGLFAQVTAYLDRNKELKAAIFSAIINLLGVSGLAGSAYAAFRLAGLPSTPTPVEVVAPAAAYDNGPALLP